METLYYTVTPQRWDIDSVCEDNGTKNIRLYDVNTQDFSLVLVAEIEAPNEANSEVEIELWMVEDSFWGADTYNFERL